MGKKGKFHTKVRREGMKACSAHTLTHIEFELNLSPFLQKNIFWVRGAEELVYNFIISICDFLDQEEIEMVYYFFIFGTLQDYRKVVREEVKK